VFGALTFTRDAIVRDRVHESRNDLPEGRLNIDAELLSHAKSNGSRSDAADARIPNC